MELKKQGCVKIMTVAIAPLFAYRCLSVLIRGQKSQTHSGPSSMSSSSQELWQNLNCTLVQYDSLKKKCAGTVSQKRPLYSPFVVRLEYSWYTLIKIDQCSFEASQGLGGLRTERIRKQEIPFIRLCVIPKKQVGKQSRECRKM